MTHYFHVFHLFYIGYGNHAFFLQFSLTDAHIVQTRTRAHMRRRGQKLVARAAAAAAQPVYQ